MSISEVTFEIRILSFDQVLGLFVSIGIDRLSKLNFNYRWFCLWLALQQEYILTLS